LGRFRRHLRSAPEQFSRIFMPDWTRDPAPQVGQALKRNSPLASRTKAALGRRIILNNAIDWNRVFA
jgi:hypothetical protein